ncbi:MAG: glucosaminidase domain-containing protein [Phaeospirillum sp.]|nr:glucosaminidase domain-containing protein [Phaeospirillum sp.]
MAAGSIGSRILTAASLIAVIGAVGGLYAMALKGERPPVQVAQRTGPSVAETAYLSGEDVASAARLDQAFQRMGYRLDNVGDGSVEVPPLFLAKMPGDLDDLPDIDTKKTVFLRLMLPLVLAVDEEIANDRARLLDIAGRKAAHRPVAADDQVWLDALALRYGVEPDNLKTLTARVDVVPPSLALAQSAEESGWGTSKLVRRSQNLFGHTVELVGDEPAMRNFATLYEAVRAYVHNLNTHKAYDELRRTRAAARARGLAPDGHALVAALHSYSERGDAYVSTIRALMRRNDLTRLDRARLGRALPGRMASAS